jgi:hypothetical protein
MGTKHIVIVLAGILAVPACAERLDGDGCDTLARSYDAEPPACREQQHNEVQLRTDPCVDVRTSIFASGAAVVGPIGAMDALAFGGPQRLTPWIDPAAVKVPFYSAFLRSRRQHSATYGRIGNARITAARNFWRAGSVRLG